MSNETTKTAVPKLRFPEFEGAGEWAFLNGNKVFDQITNKNHNSNLPILAITQEHGAIPRHLIDYNVVVTEKSIESYKVIEPGDFIISLRSFQGGIEYSTYSGICSPAYIILRSKNSGTDAFFKQYFKTPAFIGDLNKNIEGLRDGKMVSYKQFSDLFLPTPSLAEQQKIAAVLSSLDELLTAESAKLAALQAHKRGLMQGLFPAEGETVPKLRFPEFREAAEWEKKKLGELIEMKGRIGYRGYTIADIVEKGEGAISLSPGNIGNDGNLTFAKCTFISWEKYNESPEIMLSDGFTVLVKTGYSYGKAALINNLPEKTTINPQLVVLKPTRVNGVFLHLLVCNSAIQKQINETISGGDIPSLSQGTIAKFEVSIPTEAEQQKIADCLSSLDNRITAQTQRIEALKLHKKGLMQSLFPAAAEPTA